MYSIACVQMERAKHYHAKLVNIKKEMCSLHEKAAQLKVQCLQLCDNTEAALMAIFHVYLTWPWPMYT